MDIWSKKKLADSVIRYLDRIRRERKEKQIMNVFTGHNLLYSVPFHDQFCVKRKKTKLLFDGELIGSKVHFESNWLFKQCKCK